MRRNNQTELTTCVLPSIQPTIVADLADAAVQVKTTFNTVDVSSNGLLHSDPRNEEGVHEKYRDLEITWLHRGPDASRFKTSVYNRALGITPTEKAEEFQQYEEFKEMDHEEKKPVMNMVNELFTPDEASQLMHFLSQLWSGHPEHQQTSPNFPYGKLGASLGRILASSRGHESSINGYLLWELDGYDLPFKVEGFYDLSDHEIA